MRERQDKEGTARVREREGGREIFIIVVHYPHFFFDLINHGEIKGEMLPSQIRCADASLDDVAPIYQIFYRVGIFIFCRLVQHHRGCLIFLQPVDLSRMIIESNCAV